MMQTVNKRLLKTLSNLLLLNLTKNYQQVSDKRPETSKPSKMSDEQPATPKPATIKKIVEIADSSSDETEESFKSNRLSGEDDQDFIRHKTDVERRTSLENLPSGPVDEYDFQESVSSKQRKNWSSYDTKSIEQNFSNQDKMPTKKRVLDVFNQDPILRHILQREGSARCYEKVKSYFKKKSMK